MPRSISKSINAVSLCDEEMERQRFEEFCRVTFIENDSKGSKTITRAKGEKIIKLLNKDGDQEDYSPKFRHWVKTRGFQLVSHSALGLKNVLCIPAKTDVGLSTTIVYPMLPY